MTWDAEISAKAMLISKALPCTSSTTKKSCLRAREQIQDAFRLQRSGSLEQSTWAFQRPMLKLRAGLEADKLKTLGKSKPPLVLRDPAAEVTKSSGYVLSVGVAETGRSHAWAVPTKLDGVLARREHHADWMPVEGDCAISLLHSNDARGNAQHLLHCRLGELRVPLDGTLLRRLVFIDVEMDWLTGR